MTIQELLDAVKTLGHKFFTIKSEDIEDKEQVTVTIGNVAQATAETVDVAAQSAIDSFTNAIDSSIAKKQKEIEELKNLKSSVNKNKNKEA